MAEKNDEPFLVRENTPLLTRGHYQISNCEQEIIAPSNQGRGQLREQNPQQNLWSSDVLHVKVQST